MKVQLWISFQEKQVTKVIIISSQDTNLPLQRYCMVPSDIRTASADILFINQEKPPNSSLCNLVEVLLSNTPKPNFRTNAIQSAEFPMEMKKGKTFSIILKLL